MTAIKLSDVKGSQKVQQKARCGPSFRPKSVEVFRLLCEVIPGGVNSPVRAFPGLDMDPLVIAEAKGDTITDVDGLTYIDYCGSWGALIHGHAHPAILTAVQEQLWKGTTYGITSQVEERLARQVVNMMDGIEKIRFVSSGTEATMSAVRLARGCTGREVIVKFNGNYHGHADHFLVKAGSGVAHLSDFSSQGIPSDMVRSTASLPYNDVKACRDFLRDPRNSNKIAGVILEPIAGNMGVTPASQEFVQMLRDETTKIGALLIFDEVINGFRVSKKGAQDLYGIQPDMKCLGKIVGGGFPAAAFGGAARIMDHLAPLGRVYQAGTLSGNPMAMVAGYQTLKLIEGQLNFYPDLENKTNVITRPVREAIEKKGLKACIQQVGSMYTLFFGATRITCMEDCHQLDAACFVKFFRFMFDHGVYIAPSQYEASFVSSAHTAEHLEQTRDLMLEFISSL